MNSIELSEVSGEMRSVLLECEVTGNRTRFTRDGKPVAILTSWDEYFSLRETISISSDRALMKRVEEADSAVRGGEVIPSSRENVSLVAASAEALEGLPPGAREEADRSLEQISRQAITGAPLSFPLAGIWSYPADALRILYRIAGSGDLSVVLVIEPRPSEDR